MAISDPTPSCLSAEPHAASDPVMHYLGCAEFWERDGYFNSLQTPGAQKRITSELRRISYLRHVLQEAEDDPVFHLVQNLEGSMKNWRESDLYQGDSGIRAVQTWRTSDARLNGVSQEPEHRGEYKPYHPDNDIKAYILSYKDGKPVENLQDYQVKSNLPDHKILISQLLNPPNDSDGLLSKLSKTPEGSFNYLHLPANNMAVSC